MKVIIPIVAALSAVIAVDVLPGDECAAHSSRSACNKHGKGSKKASKQPGPCTWMRHFGGCKPTGYSFTLGEDGSCSDIKTKKTCNKWSDKCLWSRKQPVDMKRRCRDIAVDFPCDEQNRFLCKKLEALDICTFKRGVDDGNGGKTYACESPSSGDSSDVVSSAGGSLLTYGQKCINDSDCESDSCLYSNEPTDVNGLCSLFTCRSDVQDNCRTCLASGGCRDCFHGQYEMFGCRGDKNATSGAEVATPHHTLDDNEVCHHDIECKSRSCGVEKYSRCDPTT